jgi:glycosyltransferase involved in cell wall biosynthesis
MRIGIDARELVGVPTGVGRYASELIARWTRSPWAAGHTLVLFAPSELGTDAGWRGTGGAACDVRVVQGAGGTFWEQGALGSAAKSAGLDVFFAPGYTAPLWLRCPLVVAIHDVSFAAHPEWFRWREGLRQRMIARYTAQRAARVLTLTQSSRAEIIRWLAVPETRVEVIPPAVDAHPALTCGRSRDAGPDGNGVGQPTARVEPPYVLYVGSIFTRRHVPDLVEAFASVASRLPELQLVLVGADRSWPPQHIDHRIRTSGVASRIVWRPQVSEDALRRLYTGARVFVFLSEYEGFGLTPLESLAAGVPVIVADVPVAREAYGAAAVYVNPNDRGAIAGALLDLLAEEDRRRRMLLEAPSVLGRYSWDSSAQRTFAVLLGAGSPSS